MKHRLHPVLKLILIICGFVLMVMACLLGFMMLTEYDPRGISHPETRGHSAIPDPAKKEFTFLSWNIGYSGLDANMDFFYDGGKKVIPEPNQFLRTWADIKKTILTNQAFDFFLFQELDTRSKRAYYTNELEEMAKILPGYTRAFGKNYDCRYVPFPFYQPMGRVVSGIATFSRYRPSTSEMVSFGSNFPWPRRLVMLKRCFLITKLSLEHGKKLVIINTHNSAYDSTGDLRKKEIGMLSAYMKKEFSKGNYVIAGGDWNSNPAGFDPQKVTSGDVVVSLDYPVDSVLFPGWQFVFDNTEPSNRFTDIPYVKGKTRTTLIDFFLISPNIKLKKVSTISTHFKNSDHQPVMMLVQLNNSTP